MQSVNSKHMYKAWRPSSMKFVGPIGMWNQISLNGMCDFKYQ